MWGKENWYFLPILLLTLVGCLPPSIGTRIDTDAAAKSLKIGMTMQAAEAITGTPPEDWISTYPLAGREEVLVTHWVFWDEKHKKRDLGLVFYDDFLNNITVVNKDDVEIYNRNSYQLREEGIEPWKPEDATSP